jgi:hypothetical protein
VRAVLVVPDRAAEHDLAVLLAVAEIESVVEVPAILDEEADLAACGRAVVTGHHDVGAMEAAAIEARRCGMPGEP